MDKRHGKRLCTALLIMVIVVIVKNQYAELLLKDASYGMLALIGRQSIENLFLGSSMFRQGLDIDELNDTMAEDNYILAYNGNQPVTEYWELKNLLDHNVKIQNLYVDMYVYSAWEEPEISDEKLLLEMNISQKWALFRTIFPHLTLTSIQYFWELFIQSNNELLLTWPLNSTILNRQFRDGGSLIEAEPAKKEELDSYSAPEIEKEMNVTQQLYLNRIIALAGENDIHLIFVETPKYIVVADDAQYLNAMKQYCLFLEEKDVDCILSENTYNQINANGKEGISTYSFDHDISEFFSDALHLSILGKRQFTRNLKPYIPVCIDVL